MRGVSRWRGAATLAVAACATLALAGCVPSGSDDGGLPDDPDTLRILAGSEVKDMVPILADAAEATGVKVAFEYTGTLEGTELVASGGTGRSRRASGS